MRPKDQAPEVEKRDGHHADSVERHPAYAMIGASRISGRGILFGSDFEHNHFVEISIGHAELYRGHSNDRTYKKDELIKVALSEAQWARFVSSMNVGDGVPCTLERLNGEMIPGITAPKARHEQFKAEANAAVQETLAAMDEAITLLAAMGGERSKAGQVSEHVQRARRKLGDSLPWVAQQFGEHMEDVTEKAKIEVEAYVTATIHRAGLTALGAPAPISLPAEKKP